jgi:DNA-binding GntR family transcriptional regulator
MEHAMARREDTAHLDALLTEPEDRHTLAESITGRLRKLILDGQLRPGQALRPADLAPRLGVSAMPVREALRILEAEGLVTFKPRIGARVAEIREEDVEELYLVRGALEGLAARLAATNVTDADLAAIHEAFDQMTAARAGGDFDTFSQGDKEFHRRQYAASGRPGLVKRILDLWDVGRRIYAVTPRTVGSIEPAWEAHRAILEALDARDANAAEQLTRIHTEEAAKRILAALRELHDGYEPLEAESERLPA